MTFVDLEQKLLFWAQINPLLQCVQELITIGPENMISLVVPLPQRIAPSLWTTYREQVTATNRSRFRSQRCCAHKCRNPTFVLPPKADSQCCDLRLVPRVGRCLLMGSRVAVDLKPDG